MDIHRAQRNLKFLEDVQDESDHFISPQKSLDGTQVTELDMSSDDHIFINTQIQSRIDTEEHLESFKEQLNKFKYHDTKLEQTNLDPIREMKFPVLETTSISRKANPSKGKIRKAKSPVKKVNNSKSKGAKKNKVISTKSLNLLEQLSGKKFKIKQIIQDDTKLQFDTYNKNEWEQIKLKLQEFITRDSECDINEVFEYIYGDLKPSQSMWDASQQNLIDNISKEDFTAVVNDNDNNVNDNVSDNNNYHNEIQIISLSQLMEGNKSRTDSIKGNNEMSKNNIDLTQDSFESNEDNKGINYDISSSKDLKIADEIKEIKEVKGLSEIEESNPIVIAERSVLDDNVSVIYDSMDEFETLIPILNVPARENRLVEKFESENNLVISSAQQFTSGAIFTATSEIQVPATRSATMVEHSFTKNGTIRINVILNKLKLANKQEGIQVVDNEMIIDSDEEIIPENYELVQLELKASKNSIGDTITENIPIIFQTQEEEQTVEEIKEDITKSPAKVIRQSLKTLGLKTSNTKNEMLESLQLASETMTNPESVEDIYSHLTQTIKDIPDLLEKVYTFQPIRLNELMRRLIEKDSFIAHIDTMTIRDWTDQQGISIQQ